MKYLKLLNKIKINNKKLFILKLKLYFYNFNFYINNLHFLISSEINNLFNIYLRRQKKFSLLNISGATIKNKHKSRFKNKKNIFIKGQYLKNRLNKKIKIKKINRKLFILFLNFILYLKSNFTFILNIKYVFFNIIFYYITYFYIIFNILFIFLNNTNIKNRNNIFYINKSINHKLSLYNCNYNKLKLVYILIHKYICFILFN